MLQRGYFDSFLSYFKAILIQKMSLLMLRKY